MYLPPEAQDRLFDNITALSASGSRIGTGYVPDIRDRVRKRGRELSERWRRMGLDLNWSELVYAGERNDVVAYLNERGWQTTVRTTPEMYGEFDRVLSSMMLHHISDDAKPASGVRDISGPASGWPSAPGRHRRRTRHRRLAGTAHPAQPPRGQQSG